MNTPKLIVVSGLPGTGKSTLSEKIASHLELPIFSVDPIESAIIKAGIKKSFETGYAAYLVAEKLTEEQVKLGNAVIIDAVNAEDEAKQVWIDCATNLGIPLVVIECILKDERLHRARIEARVRGLHGFDEISWERVQERRKAYTLWKENILTVEMSNKADESLKLALDFIVRRH
jgi:predicted kinase